MFKIYDGREKFYQWDLDRQLIVEDPSITEVHFCNRTDDCSLVCETYVEDGITLVNVPNILLQNDWCIRVYAFDGNYTKHEERYDVIARTKPADYVYTETEVRRYEDLEERIAALENAPGGSGEDVDLSDYYTKEEVDSKISHVYKYCGSVNNLNELSNISTKAIGDTYNVVEGGENNGLLIHPNWTYTTTTVNGIDYIRVYENEVDITNTIPKNRFTLMPYTINFYKLTEYGWELEYGIPPSFEGYFYTINISCRDGDNVAWTGYEWDVLSGIVDLSNYYTKTQTDKKINDLSSSVDTRFLNVNTNLNNKQDKNNMINGSIFIGMSPEDWKGSYPSTPTMMQYVIDYTEEQIGSIEEATAAIIALQNSYIGGETV